MPGILEHRGYKHLIVLPASSILGKRASWFAAGGVAATYIFIFVSVWSFPGK